MRILAINQFYAPDHSATSQLLTDLCEDLAGAGDDVSVIASRGGYLGDTNLPGLEQRAGVRVVRPWTTRFGKRTIPRRVADYGSFWLAAIAQAAIETRPDVILALTTPPLIAAGAAMVAAARRVPLVSWVQDVYPEVAVEFGLFSRSHPLVPILGQTTKLTYEASRFVVALSTSMADRLAAQGARAERLRVIFNWADGRAIRPLPNAENSFRKVHGFGDRFLIVYSGNLGVGHEFDTLLGAAHNLRRLHPQALFLFIGEGARRAEVERLARDLDNVRFLPYQARDALSESLSAADVHVVTLRENLAGLLVPSKLYGALACGRPVFYIGPARCEVARAIGEDDLGWHGRTGDVQGLTTALSEAVSTPGWRSRYEERVRRVFLAKYDRSIATGKWRALLLEAQDSRHSAGIASRRPPEAPPYDGSQAARSNGP